MRIGYGITGDTDAGVVRDVARAVEQAGLTTLWINHGAPSADALGAMAAATEATTTLRIASGVIPLERVPAEEIAGRARDLPADRAVVGVGASRPPSPLARVREAIRTLAVGPGIPVVVGALGPRMRRLGVQEAGGILLNWLTPDAARLACADRDRDTTGRTAPGDAVVALYVRCALPDAHDRVREEAAKYAAIPTYAANFERLGFEPLESAVLAQDAGELRDGIEAYAGSVDETVVRAVTPTNALDEHLALISALAGD